MDEKRRQRYLAAIKKFCLFDDKFMTKFFDQSPECVELVLQIILDQPALKVKDFHVQHVVQNLQGRSVRFDIAATDSRKTEYDVEIQRDNDGADARRARENSSLLDANLLASGELPKDLPETYVIFVTANDVLGQGWPIYHIDRYIKGANGIVLPFGDGAHIIYVNGANKDDTPLGRLMHDFRCADPQKMFYNVLAKRADFLKNSKEGVEKMGTVMEDLIKIERQEARQEAWQEAWHDGRQNTLLASIKNVMASLKYSAHEAMAVLGIAPSEYEQFDKLLAAN